MANLRRITDPFPTLPGFFQDFFNNAFSDWGLGNFSDSGTSLPAVNIQESVDGDNVEMAAPGMNKNDFHIQLEGNELTISSEKKEERTEPGEQKGSYRRREFSYQSFRRSFTLPKDVVDEDKIQARYEDGILKLHIPKREEAKPKPPRRIEIS